MTFGPLRPQILGITVCFVVFSLTTGSRISASSPIHDPLKPTVVSAVTPSLPVTLRSQKSCGVTCDKAPPSGPTSRLSEALKVGPRACLDRTTEPLSHFTFQRDRLRSPPRFV